MKITWTEARNAPCAGLIVADDGRDILIQTDWDYPSVASVFGWNIRNCQVGRNLCIGATPCDHRGTDGTIDCPDCGFTAHNFILAASEWLADNFGARVEDPGYFDGVQS